MITTTNHNKMKNENLLNQQQKDDDNNNTAKIYSKSALEFPGPGLSLHATVPGPDLFLTTLRPISNLCLFCRR